MAYWKCGLCASLIACSAKQALLTNLVVNQNRIHKNLTDTITNTQGRCVASKFFQHNHQIILTLAQKKKGVSIPGNVDHVIINC